MTWSVAVIGGGQAGLAVGFYLARAQRDAERRRRPASWTFSILDGRPSPGGSWNDMWPSLRLFSPAASSSLPGMRMPASAEVTASAAEVVSYLDDYEARYALPVSREVVVDEVTRRADGAFTIRAGDETCSADAVVMATGTWGRPFVPAIAGRSQFTGAQLHAHDYDGPDAFAGRRVAVVGGANSGAQIAADLSASAEVTWITRRAPRYLPDDVDGRALFDLATRQVQGSAGGVSDLGDIVAVPPVRAARDRGLRARWDLARWTPTGARWQDGTESTLDAIIWCTGFRPDLDALRGLDLQRHHGIPATRSDLPTASSAVPGLYFVGYGDWCGPASATLVGVGRMAKATVADLT